MNDEKELYPGHATDVAKQAQRQREIAAANATPLPGPMLEAFAHLPDVIAGLTVRPLVHYDFVILRQLGSPLLEQMTKESATAGEARTDFTDEQGYEMIFQFTRPAREAAAIMARGREAFATAAREQIGMTVGPVDVALLVKSVEREFIRAFSTIIKYAPGKTGGETETVFSPPPAAPLTASAGG